MTDHLNVKMTIANKDKSKLYTLTLNKPVNDDIKINETVISNGVYSRHNISVLLHGEMLEIPNIYKKKVKKQKRFIYETHDDYLKRLLTINPSNCGWIYNIIDGITEQESVIYNDEHFLIIPNFTWSGKHKKYMRILAIIKNKNFKSLRCLTADNIPLLNHVKNTSTEVIEKYYGCDPNTIKMYVHYPPSTWQLHVHITPLENIYASSHVEYSHNLDNVIYNLGLSTNYYKDCAMQVLDD